MFECYGWISVVEEDPKNETKIISVIENTFAQHITFNTHTMGRYMNGAYKASILINTNHASAWSWVEALYKTIAEKSDFSYGLVMYHNDEDLKGYENAFQTWVLKRGVFAAEKDLYLSPRNPTVEL